MIENIRNGKIMFMKKEMKNYEKHVQRNDKKQKLKNNYWNKVWKERINN